MVKYGEQMLDRTFAALADPTRRALLARLRKEDGISGSELAQPFAMWLPAVMKDLDVLWEAGLVAPAKNGRGGARRVSAGPMGQAGGWANCVPRLWS